MTANSWLAVAAIVAEEKVYMLSWMTHVALTEPSESALTPGITPKPGPRGGPTSPNRFGHIVIIEETCTIPHLRVG